MRAVVLGTSFAAIIFYAGTLAVARRHFHRKEFYAWWGLLGVLIAALMTAALVE